MKLVSDSNLVFVHITKTGGMSVTRHLGLQHLATDHLIAKEERHLLGDDYVRFCVVREPLQRFVSAFKYSLHMLNNGRYKRPVRDFIDENRVRGDINAFVRACQTSDFPLHADLHFRPQMWWVRRARPQILPLLETIETDIRIIDRLLGRQTQDFPRVNEMKDAAFSDVKVELDDNALAYCRNLYREDFGFLGYRRRGADTED